MMIILNILLLSLAIFIVSKLLPWVHIKHFGTAIVVALVYSLINFLFGWLLLLLTLPLTILTLGLFKFVINAFLLWITDKLIDDFEIDSFGATLIAAFLIAVVDSLLRSIIY